MRKLRILLIEDSKDDADLIYLALEQIGYSITSARVDREENLIELLKTNSWDVVLTDYSLPTIHAKTAIHIVKEYAPELPIIFVSGTIGEETAVDLIRSGASDYVMKHKLAGLAPAIERQLAEAKLQKERREAEKALRESEERTRLLIDSIKDVSIFQIDESGFIVSWSHGAERLFGYASTDAIGKSSNMIYSLEDQDHQRLIRDIAEAQKVGKFTAKRWHLRADRSLFFADILITSIYSENGDHRGYAVIARDITREQLADEERDRLYLQMQQANRMKDEFLATLSHELRTPLGIILGNLEILAITDQNSKDYVEAYAAIKRNALLQFQLIKELLDVSRIISGKLTLSTRWIDLKSLVISAIDSLRFSAEAKGLDLSYSIDLEDGAIFADPDRLQQVLWNLITNAIKFTPRGGWISVKLAREANNSILLLVSDSGEGIEADFLPFVFERFRQEDSSRSRRFGGLGLGLAIVRHIVELHGGNVSVESDGKNQGSTFTVRLPASKEKYHPNVQETKESWRGNSLASQNIPRLTSKELSNMQILVVDDQIDSLLLTKHQLEQAGAVVTHVNNARLALQHLRNKNFDLLIFDLAMPEVDGIELLRKARDLKSPDSTPPAIALTAYARDNDRNACNSAGFALHLSKPVQQVDLVKAVLEVRHTPTNHREPRYSDRNHNILS